MYTQEQQLQIAIAYAKAITTEEITPSEFLNCIEKMLEEFKPAESTEPKMVFHNNTIDPDTELL